MPGSGVEGLVELHVVLVGFVAISVVYAHAEAS